jgi:hypothetical protein
MKSTPRKKICSVCGGYLVSMNFQGYYGYSSKGWDENVAFL